MTSRLLSALALALFLPACASAPASLADDTVIRGKRVGDVQLGMPLSSLLAVKGAPLRTAPIANTSATTYTFANGLTVGADEKVYWIITEDARFATPEGVRPGAEQIFARSALGKPRCVETREDTTLYDYGDIYFEAGNSDGRVKRVGVIAHKRPCAAGK